MAEKTTWRDQLQPASFRGVPFHVSGTDSQLGRRTVVHEYPLRDKPYAEDLGRKAREFSIEAFVIGDQYTKARDKLIDALEAYGSGELVHPSRGRGQVVVTSARLSESSAEGGLAKFSITFTESGAPRNPSRQSDTKTKVKTAAAKAKTSMLEKFAKSLGLDGLPDFVSTEALASVNASLNSIRIEAASLIGNALMPEFLLQLSGIASNVTSLMRMPADLAFGLMGMVQGLAGIAGGPISALSSLRGLFSFGATSTVDPYATPSRQQQTINHNAVVELTRQAAVIEAAIASTDIIPASYSDAIALRDELADQLETLASSTSDDALFMALTDLRIAVIQDITARAADLSRTVRYPVPVTLPVQVVAYRLYGGIGLADGIVSRNHLEHPGFVLGGETIEVLTP